MGAVIGGAIDRDGQYTFNEILFNNALQDVASLKVLTCEGLFDLPQFKGTSSELDDDHGGQVNRQLLSMRRIVMELAYLSTSQTDMFITTEEIARRLQPQDLALPLTFRRPGIGTRFVNARVARFTGFRNEWDKVQGLATAAIEFVCPDPRKFASAQSSQPVLILASELVGQAYCNMNGNFLGGARPILELAGPATNPRISNGADGDRSLKLDLVVGSGQTLVIDAATRSIKLDGVDQSDKVRTDNQWWVLKPGANLITVSRSNSPANVATLTVRWWDSYA